MNDPAFWRELGQQLRVDSIRSSSAAGSGHPTSSMSAADLMAVLFANHLHYDFGRPDDPRNDHLIFSKGHASPLYYSLLKAAGAITDEELLTFRRLGSRFEGHPTPVLPWVDVATGSLGQGLPIGVGVALAGKRLDQLPYRVWVLCGDSEMAEGSIWEAFEHAAYANLDNLTAIIDVNRLGQTRQTMHGWDLDSYADRARAFGWHAIEIDGHDVEAIDGALSEASHIDGKPSVIVARTKKGKGATEVEDLEGKHGKPLSDPEKAIEELGGVRELGVDVAKPEGDATPHEIDLGPAIEWPTWGADDKVATRRAYGDALAALGAERADVVALDGEVSNSTFSELFRKAHPDRYFEMFIAEQQMVAAAVGLQVRHYRPFASTFAAFFTRAYDFVRMAAISRAKICLVGSHAGVAIGEDGPSQMALEDLAIFRAVHSSIVLYPSDPNQAASLVRLMADHPGIAYMRTSRGAYPTIYGPGRPVRGRRLECPALLRRRSGDANRRRRDASRGAEGGRSAVRAGHRGPRDRPLLGQARRRRDPAPGRGRHRRNPDRRGSLARGRARRRGARRAGRGRRRPRPQARDHRDARLRHARGARTRIRHRR